jgi:hypothetical protein
VFVRKTGNQDHGVSVVACGKLTLAKGEGASYMRVRNRLLN